MPSWLEANWRITTCFTRPGPIFFVAWEEPGMPDPLMNEPSASPSRSRNGGFSSAGLVNWAEIEWFHFEDARYLGRARLLPSLILTARQEPRPRPPISLALPQDFL